MVSLRQSDPRSCGLKLQHSIASPEGPQELVTIPFSIKKVVRKLQTVEQGPAPL